MGAINPATLSLIIQGIQAAISAAPAIVDVVNSAKTLITSLFEAKVINKAQQDALHLHIDGLAALSAHGILPVWWTVEQDPQS